MLDAALPLALGFPDHIRPDRTVSLPAPVLVSALLAATCGPGSPLAAMRWRGLRRRPLAQRLRPVVGTRVADPIARPAGVQR
jgi:hypothetical protein